MAAAALLAIDQGTTSTRAIVFDKRGSKPRPSNCLHSPSG